MRKDPEYLEWIRTKDCAFCGASSPSEPHHYIGEFNLSGIGLKAPDIFAMPTCRKCHDWMHGGGDAARSAQRKALIKTLILAIDEGMLVRGE